MNKYVIELRPDCKVVQEICESDGKVSIGAKSIEYFEELNADYVNEHYGDLQDTAYQKGFEDGVTKRIDGDACTGCKYKGNPNDNPCKCCSNGYPNQWTAKDDEIEVGDEVEVLNSGNKYLIAWFAGTSLCGFAHDGVTCRLQPSDVRKTGRHFDIASILEAMKHD